MKKIHALSLACVLGVLSNTAEAKKEYFKEYIDHYKKEREAKDARAAEIYAGFSSADKDTIDDIVGFITAVGYDKALWNIQGNYLIGRFLVHTSFSDIHKCLENLSPHQVNGVILSVRARTPAAARLLDTKVNGYADVAHDAAIHAQLKMHPELEKDIRPLSIKKDFVLSNDAKLQLSAASIGYWAIINFRLQN